MACVQHCFLQLLGDWGNSVTITFTPVNLLKWSGAGGGKAVWYREGHWKLYSHSKLENKIAFLDVFLSFCTAGWLGFSFLWHISSYMHNSQINLLSCAALQFGSLSALTLSRWAWWHATHAHWHLSTPSGCPNQRYLGWIMNALSHSAKTQCLDQLCSAIHQSFDIEYNLYEHSRILGRRLEQCDKLNSSEVFPGWSICKFELAERKAESGMRFDPPLNGWACSMVHQHRDMWHCAFRLDRYNQWCLTY